MWVERQIRLSVLLSLFSIGIGVPAVCFTDHGNDDKTSYSELSECEQREHLVSCEVGTALTGFEALSLPLCRSLEDVLGVKLFEPEQVCYCAVGSRAPPV